MLIELSSCSGHGSGWNDIGAENCSLKCVPDNLRIVDVLESYAEYIEFPKE